MVYLNIDEEVEFLVEKTGCTTEEGYRYTEAEDEFLDSKGLINWECDEESAEVEGPYEGAPVIDNDDMVAFIAKRIGVSNGLAEAMTMAELEYFEKVGIVGGAAC